MYQTFFNDMRDNIQTDMLPEFSGKDGKRQQLIDVKEYQEQQAARQEIERLELLGQQELL